MPEIDVTTELRTVDGQPITDADVATTVRIAARFSLLADSQALSKDDKIKRCALVEKIQRSDKCSLTIDEIQMILDSTHEVFKGAIVFYAMLKVLDPSALES